MSAPAALSSVLPAALVAWRRAKPSDRAVCMRHGGEIVLTEWIKFELHEAHFASLAAAERALAGDSIKWQPRKPKTKDTAQQRRAGQRPAVR